MTFYLWSQTASDNDTADPTANLREGWSPSIVNNAIRALMAAAAKFRDDISGILQTSGSSSAYAVATNQGLTDGIPDGFSFSFRVHTGNDEGVTLNPDAQGDTPLRAKSGVDLPEGALVEGQVYKATYVEAGSEFLLQGYFAFASSLINIPLIVGDGSNVIPTGLATAIGPFDFSFEVLGWSAIAWQSGSIGMQVLKPTFADDWDNASSTWPIMSTASGTNAISISSDTQNQSDTVAGWAVQTVDVGDILALNITSSSGIKLLQIMLKARKTS